MVEIFLKTSHIIDTLLGFITLFLVYRVWETCTDHRRSLVEANDLLENLKQQEHKARLMLHSLEGRQEALFDQEENDR